MPESKEILNDLISSGTRQSYESFFKHYYQDLFLWANSIVKNPEAAEDIVQEFFISFWEKKRFKSVQKNLQAYIYQAIKNSCFNYIQKEKKLIYDISSLEDKESAPLVNKQEIENSQKIYSAINELPKKCKEVFLQCCVQGYSYEETAQNLGISINTVRTQMYRSFKMLRKKLKSPYLFYWLFCYRS